MPDKKFLEFVLQKHKNGLPIPSETILMQAFEVLPYIVFHSDFPSHKCLGCKMYAS